MPAPASPPAEPETPPERPWRLVASLLASGAACLVGLACWWPALPGLWELATATFTGPIRPMGPVGLLVTGFLGGLLIATPFSLLAYWLSRHPAAQTAAAMALLAAQLPAPNFVLFFAIVFARGIELAS